MSDIEEPTTVEDTTPYEVEEEEEEAEFVGDETAAEVKLFGKWSFEDIEVRDISLEVRLRKNQMREIGMIPSLSLYIKVNVYINS
jgi:hypothetical protein